MQFGQFEIIRWHPSLTPAQSIEAVMEKIELGDTLGIDEIWIGEHHFTRHGLVSGIFSMLGNVAQRTKNARIGSAIVVLPWRSPIQVAEEAATKSTAPAPTAEILGATTPARNAASRRAMPALDDTCRRPAAVALCLAD